MVSKKIINILGFDTIQEYFDYIVESVVNGQKFQATELAKDLSKSQSKDYFDYIQLNYANHQDYNYLIKLIF